MNKTFTRKDYLNLLTSTVKEAIAANKNTLDEIFTIIGNCGVYYYLMLVYPKAFKNWKKDVQLILESNI